jgi:hypothetical protein
MNISSVNIAALLLATLVGLYPGHAVAGAQKSQSKAVNLQEAYVWYDGQQERKIWMSPDLVAEFSIGTGTAAKSAVKSFYPDAVQVPKQRGAVRLWRLGSGVKPDAAIRSMSGANQMGKYSPVLHDSPTTVGRKRALPGNIIVYLDPAWSSETVNTWAAKRQLEIVKKLEIGPNIYLIKTGPGLDALNAANALYKSGDVVAAFPDWWVERTTR